MVMPTYRIPDSIRQIAMQGEFNEFDLNVFFSAKGKGDEAKFVYENEVQKRLDLVRGSYLPSNIDDMKLGQDKRPSMPYQMLIFSQCPHATLVAGYRKWQNQFSRHVLRGEKGISILAPTPYKIKVEKEKLDPDTKLPLLDADGNTITEEKEVQIPMFRPVKVFDVSQTDGKPLPERVQSPVAELTGNVEHYEAFMEALRRVSPVPIEVKSPRNDLDGFFSPSKQSITLRAGMSEVQTVCVAVHEIAHSKLHDYAKQPNSQPKDSNTEEIEAESIAYTVCAYFGIETSANSFGYVATWSKDKDLKAFKDSLDTIRKTSSDLISGVEQQFKEICKERGISLEPAQPAQKQPEQDIEKLYMVDNEKYIHVQRSDTGIDYTIYDAVSAKALDGGVLDDTEQLLSAAALTVCKLYNIGDAAPIRLAPLELLNGLQEANELPLGAGEQITGVEATSAAEPLPDLPQLEQDYPMPDPTVDFAQMYQFGYTDGNTMLPLSKERARELFLQDVPIFVLNSDNTEYMVLDTEDLGAHSGIFGVERTEWESVRDTLQPIRDIVAPKQPDALSYLHDDTTKTQPENYLKNTEMALEDDYGMIDGIINNGPKQTVAEQEERSSILAKLKAPVETTNRTEKHAPKRSAEKEL
jgi:antirestriction protein ArdC